MFFLVMAKLIMDFDARFPDPLDADLMGLTRVCFLDYFFGTALGIIVGTFIFTFFVGTVKEVWSSGHWEGLVSWKVFFSPGPFVFSFFIPKVVEGFKTSQRVEIA